MKSIRYEGVSFSIASILKFNTCDGFISDKANVGLWAGITPERHAARLKELYYLITNNLPQ